MQNRKKINIYINNYNFFTFICSFWYLVPIISIELIICLISDDSSGVRWIFAASKFSSKYLILLVPGIATILSPYKNLHHWH
jgi:hypothetical protein